MCFAQGVTIVFWHSYRGMEKDALEEVGANFTKAHPDIKIQFLQVPFDALPDKITAAVPRGKGPDVFIFGHDRVGYWADKKVLEPLGLWVKKDMAALYMPSTLEALTYEDALYGLPTSLKCVCPDLQQEADQDAAQGHQRDDRHGQEEHQRRPEQVRPGL